MASNVCAACGHTKEPSRPNSRFCRSCDRGVGTAGRLRNYSGRMTNYLIQGRLTEEEKKAQFGTWYGVDWANGPEVQPVIVDEFDFSVVEQRLMACIASEERPMERQYVAVVFKNESPASQRSSFSGSDKDAVIQKAIQERDRWKNNTPQAGPFRIFVGTLTEEVVQRAEYELKTLPITRFEQS